MSPSRRSPLRLPPPIPAHRWAIAPALLKGIGTHPNLAVPEAEALLDRLGFSCRHRTHVQQEREARWELSFWAHPAGLLIRMAGSSWGKVGDGGYMHAHTDPQWRGAARVGSMHLDFQMDCGTGIGTTARLESVRLSQSCALELDGTTTALLHCGGLITGDSDLLVVLEQVQKAGHFRPFSKWNPEGRLTNPFGCLMYGTNASNGADLAEHGRQAAAFHSAAPDLAPLVLRTPEDPVLSGPWPSQILEPALEYLSRTLGEAGLRYPSSAQRQRLTGWTAALLKGGAGVAAWINLNPEGPAGLLFPVAVLHAARPGTPAALLELLERCPVDTLRRWASVPDARGMTLGLHVVDMLLHPARTLSMVPAEERLALAKAVVDVLVARLGPEGVALPTSARSALGLIALQLSGSRLWQPDGDAGGFVSPALIGDFLALGRHLDAHGVDWRSRLCVQRRGERLDLPVDAALLQSLFSRFADHPDVGRFLAHCQHECLTLKVPAPEPRTRRSHRL